jgi:putative peptide zinc metalloprotease protein
MFQFDVALEGIPRLETFGTRAYVRFDHGMEPLAVRWYRAVRLLFLSRFGV